MRTLRRPMFRIGGSTGEGITSGLAPRQGYQGNGDASDQHVNPINNLPFNIDWLEANQLNKQNNQNDAWRKTKLSDIFGGDMTVGQAQELSIKMAY